MESLTDMPTPTATPNLKTLSACDECRRPSSAKPMNEVLLTKSLCRYAKAEVLGGACRMLTLQIGEHHLPLLAEEDYGKTAKTPA